METWEVEKAQEIVTEWETLKRRKYNGKSLLSKQIMSMLCKKYEKSKSTVYNYLSRFESKFVKKYNRLG
jgi:hypothetical protein